jgi:hypothetical protein
MRIPVPMTKEAAPDKMISIRYRTNFISVFCLPTSVFGLRTPVSGLPTSVPFFLLPKCVNHVTLSKSSVTATQQLQYNLVLIKLIINFETNMPRK